MLWIAGHLGPGKGFNGRLSILELEVQCDIYGVIGHPQGIRPEIGCDGTGPPVVRVDEHRARHLLKLPDPPLCNAILVMHCDSGKCEALSLL